MPKDRTESAFRVRVEAAEAARNREHPKHLANPDETRFAAAHYPMSFTKGLKHDTTTGLVAEPAHFEAFRTAIDEGYVEYFTSRVPVPTDPHCERRQWEAPTAGVVYDLQGPDAQAVTMQPAPELGSDELAYEMAEVYELALLRDVPLTTFSASGGTDEAKLMTSIGNLNDLPYTQTFDGLPRKTEGGVVTMQTAFRGSAPGAEKGPYLSQFMVMGNDTLSGRSVEEGY
ncbi:MAG: bromoperoxidase, partial [Pseudomonadota bacterium]